jgi:hypothetical protein
VKIQTFDEQVLFVPERHGLCRDLNASPNLAGNTTLGIV